MTTWNHAPVCREGAYAYTYLIRSPEDPERRECAPSLGGDGRTMDFLHPTHWSKVKKLSVEHCRTAILALLSDGVPRTFNRIGVELWDKTADILFGSNPETAIWSLVESGHVEHTMEAPVHWRLRKQLPLPLEGT